MNFLNDYGYVGETNFAADSLARITEEHRGRYRLVSDTGDSFARLKSAVYFAADGAESFPTVGDFVLYVPNAHGDGQILHTLPRRTVFERPDPAFSRTRPQAVAANFDCVFITLSLNRDFNVKKLERYLTLTWQSGAAPIVVLTKLDLREPGFEEKIALAESTAFGAAVCAVSAKTGENMAQLLPFLAPGRTAALLGSSGAGKSSLTNALLGETVMETGAVREGDARGRHTTTFRRLLRLPGGALIIDTPGMREIGMWDVTEGLSDAFEDVAALAAACRFSDCTHKNEPGCAVRAAIESGALPAERLLRYEKLRREARFSDDPAAYLHRRSQAAKGSARARRSKKGRF